MKIFGIITLTFALVCGLAFIAPASAQVGNPLVITWQAQNYFPADFPGKALITPGAPVTAAVEEISNGKLVNLQNAQISWFVNDVLAQSGLDAKSITFTASPDSNGLISIRVEVQTPAGTLDGSASILAGAPFAVIDYPSVARTVPAGGNVTLTAWPYFFNVDSVGQLNFTWQVNGQTITSGKNQLSLQINQPQTGSQSLLPVILTTQNSQNPLEFSKTTSVFNIVSQ